MTPASIASENAKVEVGYAMDHGMRILPVLLEECEIPLRLRRLQYVDFTKKNFNEGINSAKELLSKLVDEANESVPGIAESTREVPVIKEPRTVPTPKRSVSRRIQSALTAGRGRARFIAGGIGIGIIVILIVAALFLRPLLFAPPEEPLASLTPQPTRTPLQFPLRPFLLNQQLQWFRCPLRFHTRSLRISIQTSPGILTGRSGSEMEMLENKIVSSTKSSMAT